MMIQKMRRILQIILILFFNQMVFAQPEGLLPPASTTAPDIFVGLQGRLKIAYTERFPTIAKTLAQHNIYIDSVEIYLRAFKRQEELQLWAKNCTDSTFIYIKSYDFCAISGQLGPKRKEGDKQIPEGFYFIKEFMEESPYYLSLVLSYPNSADKVKGDAEFPGSDIHIHGDCVSTGCISINEEIKELYTLSHEARRHGQDFIEVHIFPSDFAATSTLHVIKENKAFESYRAFWESLEKAFCFFEKNKQIPDFRIDRDGNYEVVE